ncbi:MAG: DUF1517 domain-containing protein [Spirochaetales bacterium]|nr:DUF1517 domain-containing protein [Spirochaetales bacterium]
MGVKRLLFLLTLCLLLAARFPLLADSGGSFGGFSGFDSDSGGGFDGSSSGSDWGFDSGSSWSSDWGSDWGSDSGYSSGYDYYDYGSGSDFLDFLLVLFWPAAFAVVILFLVRFLSRLRLTRVQQSGSVLKYQVGFYGSAKEVQTELHALAEQAGRYKGNLRELMGEAVILIKRHKLDIKYGNFYVFPGSSHLSLESMFRRMVSEERARYREELIRVNFGQKAVRKKFTGQEQAKFRVAECIVVTLLVVSGKVKYPKRRIDYSLVIDMLDEIAGITDREFAGFEIVWTPENPEDAMLEEELVYKFPTLIRLV